MRRVGENSARLREQILEGAARRGFALDAKADRPGDGLISADGRTPSASVIPTNEALMIARDVFRLTAR